MSADQAGRAAYGTWLAAARTGRVGVLTNYRQPPDRIRADARGRGQLIHGFVTGTESAAVYAERVAAEGHEYNGFNLLLIDATRGEAVCVTNMEGRAPAPVPPGVHGLTNQTLDAPWPKAVRGMGLLGALLARPAAAGGDAEGLAGLLVDELLRDTTTFPDAQLPDTGCGIELERKLCSTFVAWPERGYGTRCHTVLLVDGANRCTIVERAMDEPPGGWSTVTHTFDMG